MDIHINFNMMQVKNMLSKDNKHIIKNVKKINSNDLTCNMYIILKEMIKSRLIN